ncbi:hypothetical protein [uncultured Porphyromonas sp.]|uniref:hypothetical protein n=1 Tax=uncultured Porphyromonas sp. TaxID=159274 RepID=UPI002609E21A|nr:hypothetical protein [uncultured Porphyromonas sp.]
MPTEIAPLPGCNPQPGNARLSIPEGRSPSGVRLPVCRSRRDHPSSVTAMSHERNGKV